MNVGSCQGIIGGLEPVGDALMMDTKRFAYPSQAHPVLGHTKSLFSELWVVSPGPVLYSEVHLAALAAVTPVAGFVVQPCSHHRGCLPARGAGRFCHFHSLYVQVFERRAFKCQGHRLVHVPGNMSFELPQALVDLEREIAG